MNQDMFRKPDNIFLGTLEGIKGGVMDLATGLAGIFTKPYKGAKKEGAKGFFKGIGRGLLGAITSPITAILRIGTSVIQGLEGTVNLIGKGGLSQQGRVRFPRYITSTNVIISYDPGLSEARLLLNKLNDQKYAAENILLFEVLPNNKGKEGKMVIITEKRILLINHGKTLKYKILHSNIKHAQVYADAKVGYVLDITLKNNTKVTFESTNEKTLEECASYLPTIKPETENIFKLL